MEDILILDQEGKERDWTWLVATYGSVWVERAELPEGISTVFRIAKLQERSGPAVQVVNVADGSGEPLEGVTVVRHWPDAPDLPGWPAPASVWFSRGVFGRTNENGDIGFGMGSGDFYFAPNEGASSLWLADGSGPSDLIKGLGMLGGSDHQHLDVYFQRIGGTSAPPEQPSGEPPEQPAVVPPEQPEVPPEEPPPQPPPNPWQGLMEKLDEIIALLEDHVG